MTSAPSSQPEQNAITWRTIFVGFLILLIFIPFVVYSYTVTQATDLASDHSTIAAIFFLVLLVLGVNALWIRGCRGKGLNRAELLTVYIMLIVPSAVATLGVCESLLPILVAPVYQKSAGDRYLKVVMTHVDHRIIITDPEAAREFMERLPRREGESVVEWLGRIRWGAFAPVAARWIFFLIAAQLTAICLAALFRRQWVERELLPFPLARLPLMLTETSRPGSLVPDIFRSRAFYWGALLPFILTTLQALHYYYPNFPAPGGTVWSPQLLGYKFTAKFNFIMFGFAYLVSLSSLKGLWLWALLFILFRSICFWLGVKFPENLGPLGTGDNALIYHAGMGAAIAYAAMAMWTGRRHLRDVFAKTLGLDRSVDDSGEPLPFRLAVCGSLVGSCVMLLWMVHYGVPFQAAFMLLVVTMAIYVSISKIVAEVGLAECLPTGLPGAFTISKLGPHNIGYGGVLSLAPHIAWVGDLRTFTMANATDGLRLTSEIRNARPKLLVAFFGSAVLGLVLSLLSTFLVGQATGKINTGPGWHATSFPRAAYDFVLEVLNYRQSPWSPRRPFTVEAKPTESATTHAVEEAAPDPLAPRLLSPGHGQALDAPTPVFEWEPVKGSDRYVIEVSEAETGRLIAQGWLKPNRYVYGEPLGALPGPPAALEPGKPYQWRVRAESLAGPNMFGWYATFGGMVVCGLLVLLQSRLLWWPLPATGFVIGGAWLMQHLWFAVFVAWVVKALVLRYGGASAYRKSLPFFMGLIAGQLCTLGLWAVIDILAGKRGNKLFAF